MFNNKTNTYKNKIDSIELKHKNIEDSLNNQIQLKNNKIDSLFGKNKEITLNIDSIKNKQNDNEKATYIPFTNLKPDNVVSLFSGYNTNRNY